jgi:hypothetical protein
MNYSRDIEDSETAVGTTSPQAGVVLPFSPARPQPRRSYTTVMDLSSLSKSESTSPWAVTPPTMLRAEAAPPKDAPTPYMPIAVDAEQRDPADAIQLLWFDSKAFPPIAARWLDRVTDLDFQDEERRGPASDDEDPRAARAVAAILAEEPALNGDGLLDLFHGALGARGRFNTPMAVATGDLELCFDEVERLKCIVGVTGPVAGADKALKDTIDSITALLATPHLHAPFGLAQRLQHQLQAQLGAANRALPHDYLELQVARALVTSRHYQTRSVFGAPHVRARLCGGEAVPAYLPVALAQRLPLMASFSARVVAEVVPQQDEVESAPIALRVLAIGRIVQISKTSIRKK